MRLLHLKGFRFQIDDGHDKCWHDNLKGKVDLEGKMNVFYEIEASVLKVKRELQSLHKIKKMSDHLRNHLENMDVIGLLELQSRLEVQQISSARLLIEWLEPILPVINMTERKYKRVLMENSIQSLTFARAAVVRIVNGSFDIPGGLGSLVFFTRLMNTQFYANESNELIYCVYKKELAFIFTCATGRKVRIMGGAPNFRRMASNEE